MKKKSHARNHQTATEANRSTRSIPHASLSISALRKRLYRAGVRGGRLGQIAREIHACPDPRDFRVGIHVLGWPMDELKRRYGKRIYRAVRVFVQTKWVMFDEGAAMLRDGSMAEFAERSMLRFRKPSGNSVNATQTVWTGPTGRGMSVVEPF